MSKNEIIIAEFEELLKVKEFHKEGNWLALDNTHQAILKALSLEYNGNLKNKVDRWINVTNARYFQYSLPVTYYFQSKMLYRDGFYEAAIILTRSICEMICYDYLLKIDHPFGTYQQMELENFRTLVKFLALPKKFEKNEFENNIVPKIASLADQNLIKSSYEFDGATNCYIFKTKNGKEAKNLNRFHLILDAIRFTYKDNFPADTFNLINKVYDDGNTYVHARKSPNASNTDAITAINTIGKVLAYLYLVDGPLTGKNIVSGYADFPDICQGTHFGLDAYFTPDDATRGYYNLPSQKQINKMLTLVGVWKGEWKASDANNEDCFLTFMTKGEYLNVSIRIAEGSEIIDNIAIKCFGDYFHIIVLPSSKGEKIQYHFELEFLNENVLVGQNLVGRAKAIFYRV